MLAILQDARLLLLLFRALLACVRSRRDFALENLVRPTPTVNERFFSGSTVGVYQPVATLVVNVAFWVGLSVAVASTVHALHFPLAYLKISLTLEVPFIALAAWTNRAVIRQLFAICLAIFPPSLVFELLALHNGYWRFNGDYIGRITLRGLSLPIEELLFMLLGPPSIVGTYAIYKN